MVTDAHVADAARTFHALGTPSRLAIARVLLAGPRSVTALSQELGLRQPLVSQHLAVLHAARLVCRQREGREVRYSLTDDHVAHMLDDVLNHASESRESDHEGEPHD